jgi:hypothetical protein
MKEQHFKDFKAKKGGMIEKYEGQKQKMFIMRYIM